MSNSIEWKLRSGGSVFGYTEVAYYKHLDTQMNVDLSPLMDMKSEIITGDVEIKK